MAESPDLRACRRLLWQLSDIGLGWTRFHEIGPGWTEHPAIKPYLPADINAPTAGRSVGLQFTLSNGAVLWVKPGRQTATFRWGIRAPKASAEQQA
jgi:hypothetical protein